MGIIFKMVNASNVLIYKAAFLASALKRDAKSVNRLSIKMVLAVPPVSKRCPGVWSAKIETLARNAKVNFLQ